MPIGGVLTLAHIAAYFLVPQAQGCVEEHSHVFARMVEIIK